MGETINGSKQLTMEFSMDNLELTHQARAERKMYRRITKNNNKYRHKIDGDIERIKSLIAELDEKSSMSIISNAIDAPNIINAYVSEIERIFISTWSITPAGIAALENVATNGNVSEAIILMDKTHSYKWIFASGAYQVLRGKVLIRFCASHSKFIVMQLKDGSYLNFIGSMNLSNNPRWENLYVSRLKDDFEFYAEFVKTVTSEQLSNG